MTAPLMFFVCAQVRFKHYCGIPWAAGTKLSATSGFVTLLGASFVALLSFRF